MNSRRGRKPDSILRQLLAFCAITVCALAIKGSSLERDRYGDQPSIASTVREIFQKRFKKSEVAQILGRRAAARIRQRSERVTTVDGELIVQYTINPNLQETIEDIYRTAKVPYGAFVAMDPVTGKILAMVSHGKYDENMALRATFPAASVFKVVTAAAAIEAGRLSHDSLIPVVGSYHTLYKRNVLRSGGIDAGHSPRYARLISFSDALAKSVNSVFGKVGIFGVGHEGIRKAADNFAFNREIPFELSAEESRVNLPTDTFGLAESASGFTKHNTLSPLHGAMIAAAVVNDGLIMEPSIVENIRTIGGDTVYEYEPVALNTAIDKRTASELKVMLNRTITNGTSRGAFRGIARTPTLASVYMGGKTGTLNGWDPPGRYDWFVGFAESGSQKLAVAALCIHGGLRGMKASKIARRAFESFFSQTIAKNE